VGEAGTIITGIRFRADEPVRVCLSPRQTMDSTASSSRGIKGGKMATTVLEALEGAKINFENLGRMGLENNPFFRLAMNQLKNGVEALENGKHPNDVLQEEFLGEIKK